MLNTLRKIWRRGRSLLPVEGFVFGRPVILQSNDWGCLRSELLFWGLWQCARLHHFRGLIGLASAWPLCSPTQRVSIISFAMGLDADDRLIANAIWTRLRGAFAR
jgi:hypothetical protein